MPPLHSQRFSMLHQLPIKSNQRLVDIWNIATIVANLHNPKFLLALQPRIIIKQFGPSRTLDLLLKFKPIIMTSTYSYLIARIKKNVRAKCTLKKAMVKMMRIYYGYPNSITIKAGLLNLPQVNILKN